MLKTSIYTLLALMVLMAGCAAKPPPESSYPAWITGQSTEYPASIYVKGRGSGTTPAMAAQSARTELASFFEVQILARMESHIAETMDNDRYQQAQQHHTHINTTVGQILEGTEISQRWYSEEEGTHYALATLHRGNTLLNLDQRRDQLGQETALLVDQARQHANALRAASLLEEARQQQQHLLALGQTRQTLEPLPAGQLSRYSQTELQQMQRERLQDVTFTVNADTPGDLQRQVTDTASAALSSWGILMDPEGEYTLRIVYRPEPLQFREQWYWLRARLEMAILEPTGEVSAQQSYEVRESSRSETTARQRAEALVLQKVRQEVAALLFNTSTASTPVE
ncbi:LPP20 family lipoprotein [Desulfurispira natronophila]|uniref:Lipoprotein LPP20-like domain-containing protein n=1 Tax=Desulfurispira natronophila TaxID=682562 RepID=A0A7W7Y4H0_9BACT|nr:LPP20 family lipoprotein [Desulfurispira natronophila]MBB5021893.1 hypothetical protein [Desulfurispira natronophila]